MLTRGAATTAAHAAGWWARRHTAAAAAVGGLMASMPLAGLGVVLLGGGQPPPLGWVAGQLDIPPVMLHAYLAAAQSVEQWAPGCRVRWQILAGIGWAESRHAAGRDLTPQGDVHPPIIGVRLDGSGSSARVVDSDRGRLDGDAAFDRAVGPMQFLSSSWAIYGQDANHDGVANPHNAYDAAGAAVAHLCAAATNLDDPVGLRRALYAYNRSLAYVEMVAARIAYYDTAGVGGSLAGQVDATGLVGHPNLTLTERAAADLSSGLVDPRVVALLARLVERHQLAVSVFKTGHSKCVGGGDYPGCSVSNHFHGRAVDIWMVDGARVSAGNPAAHQLVYGLVMMDAGDPLKPAEVGSPFAAYDPLPVFFTDGDHLAHVHIGYEQ